MKKRPVNLNLFKIRFPITAIVSIIHRVSGVWLFLLLPFILWLLDASLTSEEGFNVALTIMHQPVSKLVVWTLVMGVLYHLVAGLRHLLMDMGIGESKAAGTLSAQMVLLVTVALAVITGVWLW